MLLQNKLHWCCNFLFNFSNFIFNYWITEYINDCGLKFGSDWWKSSLEAAVQSIPSLCKHNHIFLHLYFCRLGKLTISKLFSKFLVHELSQWIDHWHYLTNLRLLKWSVHNNDFLLTDFQSTCILTFYWEYFFKIIPLHMELWEKPTMYLNILLGYGFI